MRWTEFYHLPQWESEDITTWKGQLNDAFAQIDNVMYLIGHQTYATSGDIDSLDAKINELHVAIEQAEDTVKGLEALLGEFNERLTTFEDNVEASVNTINQTLVNHSSHLHSMDARMDLIEKEMAEIGKKLTAWYFPCMDGTTLPGVADVPNGDNENT